MVNIEAIKKEVEKLTPNGYRIDEEVLSSLTAVAEFFTWLSTDPVHSKLTMYVWQSALKTDGWLRVESDHLDIWNNKIKKRLFEALEKVPVCEIYSVDAGEIVMDLSFNNLYVAEDGFIDEEFIQEKLSLEKALYEMTTETA